MKLSRRILSFTCGAIVGLATFAVPTAGQRVGIAPPSYTMAVTGALSTTNISGDAGQANTMEGPQGHVLQILEFAERRDRPCLTEGTFSKWDLEDGEAENVIAVARRGGSCSGSAERVTSGDGQAISAIRVCQRRQNDRVKGVETRSRQLLPSGTTGGAQRKFERTNCNEWQTWVECPENQVAVGVVHHYNNSSLTGVALRCRGVSWTQQPRARRASPNLTANAPAGLQISTNNGNDSNPVSGTSATQHRLSPPESHMALSRVRYGERNDRPCFLEATFWTNNGNNPRSRTVTFNECNGNHSSVRTVELPNSPSSIQVASSIAVCQRRNNDRLKGIRLLGSRVDGSGAHPDPAISREDERTNCNEWNDPSHCFQGQVAVGLNVHYLPSDNRPAEIVGLSLRCAAAENR